MWRNPTEALVVITGFHAQEDHHADENDQCDNHTDHDFGSAEEVHHGGGSFLEKGLDGDNTIDSASRLLPELALGSSGDGVQ
ncbi:MAG: hypothetical protein WHU94_02365 [Thermogemmata sp.]|uniref:Uncharacterized protein n=1 Tax=Thermogemmata fonticola TaxID=2755323 RepID=A0A7V8VFL3_9BACT|nr:hypothetical protein [Thermogemmata fonticola]MBA2227051.1 hypothetical protein [Thermogemmata fonticola]